MHRTRAAVLALLAMLAATDRAVAAGLPNNLGQSINDFTLRDHWGKRHALAEYADRTVVVIAFLGTECPLAKLYGPRLANLAGEYDEQNVVFLGVMSNQHDSLAEISAYAKRHGLHFPLLKDPGNRVADLFRAERTPEVFVLDADRRVRYRGRVDDQYGVGYSRDQPQRHFLKDAIDQVFNGEEVALAITETVGCHIGRVREADEQSPVTYSRQISRILQKHCVQCHRAGEIAPFELTEYEEVAGWAEMIAEVVRQQRMPPWHANPKFGQFANQRVLTTEEKNLIYRWVAAGAPQGDLDELPPPRKFVRGWQLPREPDLVLPMRSLPFTVPAEGTVEYQYFAVDPGFTEDKWVRATDIVPGNREVVHHAIVFIAPPADRRERGLGWLAAYVPGQSAVTLADGQGVLVPAGSRLIFQMHYTPNGTVQHDKTKIGLVFADAEKITEEVITLFAVNAKFEIPPGAGEHRVDAWRRSWPRGARLLAMAPHMHVRGKSFRFIGHHADGRREVLLDVPQYDFNWQHNYQLKRPLEIPDGFAMHCVAHFDNSRGNLVNPDPTSPVRWGDQSWEEMMIGFFFVAVPRDSLHRRPPKKPLLDAEELKARNVAEELFQRFDGDGDRRIRRRDVPSAFRVYGFSRYDANGDGVIEFAEAYNAARRQS